MGGKLRKGKGASKTRQRHQLPPRLFHSDVGGRFVRMLDVFKRSRRELISVFIKRLSLLMPFHLRLNAISEISEAGRLLLSFAFPPPLLLCFPASVLLCFPASLLLCFPASAPSTCCQLPRVHNKLQIRQILPIFIQHEAKMKAKNEGKGVIRRKTKQTYHKLTTTNNSLPTVKRCQKKALTTSQNMSTARKTSAAHSTARRTPTGRRKRAAGHPQINSGCI